jgi:hypothetical protein
MSQPIHVLYLIKRKEAWYQLSDEEKNFISQQTLEVTTRAGGKRLVICDATWSSGECEFFELTEFPEISAARKRIELYEQIDIFRYYEISTILGSALAQTCHDTLQVE